MDKRLRSDLWEATLILSSFTEGRLDAALAVTSRGLKLNYKTMRLVLAGLAANLYISLQHTSLTYHENVISSNLLIL